MSTVTPAPVLVWVGKERAATAGAGGAPAPATTATRYTRLQLPADALVDELAGRAAAAR